MDNVIIYEQPLNERIRLFLRLEHLFNALSAKTDVPNEWQTRWAVDRMLDLLDLLGRSDVRGELIKELERVAASLTQLENTPEVDHDHLHVVLADMDVVIDRLHNAGPANNPELLEFEMVNGLRRRHHIAGGKCDFDQPAFHFWLRQSPNVQDNDLAGWLKSFDAIRNGIVMFLDLIREAAVATNEAAENGFFQRALDVNRANHLLRVGVDADSTLYPEISAGKHRFTVRFLKFHRTGRPGQTDQLVRFKLSCCSL